VVKEIEEEGLFIKTKDFIRKVNLKISSVRGEGLKDSSEVCHIPNIHSQRKTRLLSTLGSKTNLNLLKSRQGDHHYKIRDRFILLT
jgi:hypothetical protein